MFLGFFALGVPAVGQISGSGTSVADPLSSGVTTVAEQLIQNQLSNGKACRERNAQLRRFSGLKLSAFVLFPIVRKASLWPTAVHQQLVTFSYMATLSCF